MNGETDNSGEDSVQFKYKCNNIQELAKYGETSKAIRFPKPQRGLEKNQGACSSFANCTCCTTQHSNAIKKIMSVHSESGLSPACIERLQIAQCSLCSPQAGIFGQVKFCPSLCDELYDACKTDYFTYQTELSSKISPCSRRVEPSTGKQTQPLVCFWLQEALSNSTSFCKSLGHPVASSNNGNCYSGQLTQLGASLCVAARAEERQYMQMLNNSDTLSLLGFNIRPQDAWVVMLILLVPLFIMWKKMSNQGLAGRAYVPQHFLEAEQARERLGQEGNQTESQEEESTEEDDDNQSGDDQGGERELRYRQVGQQLSKVDQIAEQIRNSHSDQ